MAPRMTPAAYVAKIKQYPPGDPRREVAVRRAAYAVQAARAWRNGDMAAAGAAMRGLHGLAGFGDIDPETMAGIIRRTSLGGLTPDQARSIARTISTITSIVGSVMQILALAVGGDVGKVLRWIDAIIRGNAPPEALTNNDFVNFCRVWQGMSSSGFVAAATSAVNGVASAARWPADQRNNVNLFVRWAAAALDSICAEVGPISTASPVDTRCATNGDSPVARGLPREPSSCCPGLYLAEDGRCMPPPPNTQPSPAVAARNRWVRALVARRDVEVALVNPGTLAANRARYQALDGSTATELCAAENGLLEHVNPLPAWNTPPSETQVANATLAMSTGGPLAPLAIAALYSYMPPSSKPRNFIRTPPPGRPTCANLHPTGDGDGGGGGGGALLLPAAAILWYMLK